MMSLAVFPGSGTKQRAGSLSWPVNQGIVSVCPLAFSPYTPALLIPSAWNESTVVNPEIKRSTQNTKTAGEKDVMLSDSPVSVPKEVLPSFYSLCVSASRLNNIIQVRDINW